MSLLNSYACPESSSRSKCSAVWYTSMDSPSSLAPKPFKTLGKLLDHCSLLFTGWFSSLLHTFVSLLIALTTESPITNIMLGNRWPLNSQIFFSYAIARYNILQSVLYLAGSYHSSSPISRYTHACTHTQTDAYKQHPEKLILYKYISLYIHAHPLFIFSNWCTCTCSYN